ncbi:Yos1-like-domain-containing protein [Chiua virens]|nr:Yos1-like-domain-containing protein [Chiua virens]
MLTIGTILYVSLLLINAVAVLSEDRFLARIGWSSTQSQNPNAGFHQPYDQSGYGYAQQDVGVKVRIINLISAVRTLMRSKHVQHAWKITPNAHAYKFP